MERLTGERVEVTEGVKASLPGETYRCRACGTPVRFLPGSGLGAVHVQAEAVTSCKMEGRQPCCLEGES